MKRSWLHILGSGWWIVAVVRVFCFAAFINPVLGGSCEHQKRTRVKHASLSAQKKSASPGAESRSPRGIPVSSVLSLEKKRSQRRGGFSMHDAKKANKQTGPAKGSCSHALANSKKQKAVGRRSGTKKRVHRATRWLAQILVDAGELNYNLLSVDSAKIITGCLPCYLTARRFDDRVQCRFYDKENHKNINQLPQACHQVAKAGVGIPMVFLSCLSFAGWTDDIAMTGRLTAIGLPFVHWGKVIIKQWRSSACLRPWNEYFSPYERSCGGFPSGHMANVSFMTALWAKRHGPAWGIPLGLFGVFVFADFINCNRHYFSQLIAGAGLGVLYAYAADKVITKRLASSIKLSACSNSSGTGVQLSYTF